MRLKKIKKLVFRKNTQEVNRRFWERIIKAQRAEWEQALYRAQKGPKILIATSTGKEGMARPVESLLAVALTLRGANVHILLCDQFLPACSIAISTRVPNLYEFVTHGLTQRTCPECHQKGVSAYEALGLPIFSYRRLVAPGDIQTAEETAEVHSDRHDTNVSLERNGCRRARVGRRAKIFRSGGTLTANRMRIKSFDATSKPPCSRPLRCGNSCAIFNLTVPFSITGFTFLKGLSEKLRAVSVSGL